MGINPATSRKYVEEPTLIRLQSRSRKEAEEVITNIFENEIKTDPKDQWLKMLKDGVFNS